MSEWHQALKYRLLLTAFNVGQSVIGQLSSKNAEVQNTRPIILWVNELEGSDEADWIVCGGRRDE
jgi:hypothetical protein